MGIDDRLLLKVFWTVYDKVHEGSMFVENVYSIHKNAYGSTWFLISPLFYCFLWEISNSFDLRPKPHFSILVWNLYKRGTVSWYDLSQILSEYSNQGYCYPQNNLSLFFIKMGKCHGTASVLTTNVEYKSSSYSSSWEVQSDFTPNFTGCVITYPRWD